MVGVTRFLSQIKEGDPNAADRLLPLVYQELRRLAAAYLVQEKPGQTLQPTALVHEAYLRLMAGDQSQYWNSRGHFFAAAAQSMRRILVETARRKQTLKAGGGRQMYSLQQGEISILSDPDRLLAIDEALTSLALHSPEVAKLVELRVYAGLSVADAAEVLGIARTTAYRHWTYARAWLRAELAEDT